MDDKITAIHPGNIKPDDINPLIADNPKDTMNRVASALTYLSVLQYGNDGPPVDDTWDKWRYGRSLIYRTLIHALTVQSTKRNPQC